MTSVSMAEFSNAASAPTALMISSAFETCVRTRARVTACMSAYVSACVQARTRDRVRKRACARARDAPRSRARRMVKRMEDRWAHVSEHEESDSPLGEELGRPPKPCGPHRLFPKNSLNHCSNTTVTRVVLHASASPSASLLSCTSDTVANRPFLGVPAGTPRLARGRRCAPARCRRGTRSRIGWAAGSCRGR